MPWCTDGVMADHRTSAGVDRAHATRAALQITRTGVLAEGRRLIDLGEQFSERQSVLLPQFVDDDVLEDLMTFNLDAIRKH